MELPLTPLAFGARARRLYGGREAVRFNDVRFTYAEFLDRCDRWSSRLQSLGVKPGDRVAYIAQNIPAHLEGYYAIPQIGAVLVPINYRLAASDFVYIANHSGARVLCVDRDYVEAIEAVRDQLSKIEYFVSLEGPREGWLDYEAEIIAASPAALTPVSIDENDLMTINYTSGTTARPKGVMITHRNAYLNVLGTLAHFAMSPADHYLWTLPMFHANGWTFVWLVTARGAAHVCLRKVDPVAIFRQVGEAGVTTLCAAPTVLIGIANAPAEARAPAAGRKVRLLTAGAPPAAVTIDRIERELGWEVQHVYGLTETSPLILLCEPLPEHTDLSGSERAAIKARQGVELVSSGEILVMDGAGDAVPKDGKTLGEICVRGNVVMKGYFNDPEATAAAFKGGWFHTGDAAVVHPDGYVEIKDRFKDVIISGGENISSVEIEGLLLRHPAVQEVSVVGMPHPRWGEAPHAFVVLKTGAAATEAEMREFARDNLAHFKVPQWVTFIEELPKTATGKIQKFVLRGRAPGIVAQ
jgi:fatty-acyl-CoA synthase